MKQSNSTQVLKAKQSKLTIGRDTMVKIVRYSKTVNEFPNTTPKIPTEWLN